MKTQIGQHGAATQALAQTQAEMPTHILKIDPLHHSPGAIAWRQACQMAATTAPTKSTQLQCNNI